MVLQLEITETCDTVRPAENVGGRDVTSIVLPLYILCSGLYRVILSLEAPNHCL